MLWDRMDRVNGFRIATPGLLAAWNVRAMANGQWDREERIMSLADGELGDVGTVGTLDICDQSGTKETLVC